LGHDGFEDFVDDRGEDALVIVGAELAVAVKLVSLICKYCA
jgi:hypothetical protein